MPAASHASMSNEKTMGLIVVVLGLLCSVFVAIKIKRKVSEINQAAEESSLTEET